MEVYIDLLCLLLAWHGVSAQMDNEFDITMKADPMTITPVITKEISFKCAVPDSGNRRFGRISSIGLVTGEGDRYLAVIYIGGQAYIPDGTIFQGQEVKGNIYIHDNTSTGYLTLTIDYPTIEEVNTNANGTVCKVIGYEDSEEAKIVERYVSVQVATVDATFQSLGGLFKVDPINIIYPLTDKLSVDCSIYGTNNTFETVSSIEIKKDGVVVLDTNNTNLLPNAIVEINLPRGAGYLRATVKYPKESLVGSFECIIQVGNDEGTKLNVTSASYSVNHTDPSFADLVERVYELALENNDLVSQIKTLESGTGNNTNAISALEKHDNTQDTNIKNNGVEIKGVQDRINVRCGGAYTHLKNGICYAYVTQSKNWASAQTYCNSIGGYLAEARTKDQNDFIKSIIPSGSYVWLGATSLWGGAVTEWRWSTSGDNNLADHTDFTAWISGEPNNSGGQEHCMQLRGSRWNDINCNGNYKFVCQRYMNYINN